MTTRDPLRLALHYQSVARRDLDESRYWIARSLYYGRLAARAQTRPAVRGGDDHVP